MESDKYSLPKLRKHWAALSSEFASEYTEWINLFSDLVRLVSHTASRFEGKRKLPENCCYLLLSKSINHTLAAYVLLERGLIIDAALSARNALETLLMLELFAKDRSVNHFELWANGKRYSPSDVRARLKKLSTVHVGDVIITVDDEYQKTIKFVYDVLSQITHSNIESLQHTVSADSPQTLKVWVGGSLQDQRAFINAIFVTISHNLLTTVMVCCAVFDLAFLEESKDAFGQLSRRIKVASNS